MLRFTLSDGRRFATGRRAPVEPPDVPALHRFMGAATLPPPAVRADWLAGPSLNRAGQLNILGNDRLGCCEEAACGHIIDAWHADAGTGSSVTEAQTVGFYSASSGYVEGNPATDVGSDPVTVLEYWMRHGFAPGLSPIAGYVSVDPSNIVAVKTAIWLFGNIIIGGSLLTAWIDGMQTMQPGFTWDAGSPAQKDAGHAFPALGYNSNGPFINTWAMPGTLTWKGLAAFAGAANGGDCFTILSPDWENTLLARSPSGFNIGQLRGYLSSL